MHHLIGPDHRDAGAFAADDQRLARDEQRSPGRADISSTRAYMPGSRAPSGLGMYTACELMSARPGAPLLIPSEALIVRGEGASVAVVHRIRWCTCRRSKWAARFGDRLEVMSGLREGESIPGDTAREGIKVEAVKR